jgi:hypothetical protein
VDGLVCTSFTGHRPQFALCEPQVKQTTNRSRTNANHVQLTPQADPGETAQSHQRPEAGRQDRKTSAEHEGQLSAIRCNRKRDQVALSFRLIGRVETLENKQKTLAEFESGAYTSMM